jgi:UDP-glucose 4-epimerase
MDISLTGGAGYISGHTAVVLLLDNFCNSNKSVLQQIEGILEKAIRCFEGDVRDSVLGAKTLQERKIDAVIRFAGLKAVGESVANPVLHYSNNVQASIGLLQAMQNVDIKTLVFSSSATVYGEPEYLPNDENQPTKPINPYGKSRLQVKEILQDLAATDARAPISFIKKFN